MTIQVNSVEQINVALLEIDSKLRSLSIDSAALRELTAAVDAIKLTLNDTKAGLESGGTYNINITGNAATATTATTAGSATSADYAATAGSASTADYAIEADSAGLASTVDTNWLLDRTYPVNSIYLSSVDVSPAADLGGSWTSVTAPTGMYAWKRTA